MATHSSILAWKIPWTEEPGGLQSLGSQTVGHHWVANFHFHINGILQYLSFCEWLISLSLMSSRFIHGTTHEGVSFLHKVELYSII